MLCPDFKEFEKKTKEGNLVPVYREILADLETPLSAFLKLKAKTGFLLESVEGGEKWARYSFIGCNPSITLESKGKNLTIKRGVRTEKTRFDNARTSESTCLPDRQACLPDRQAHTGTRFRDPLEIISAELRKYKPVIMPGLPRFFGGFVGYIGYDVVRHFERLPDNRHKGLDLPDMFLMFTDTLLVFDNLTQKIKIISNALIEGDPKKAYEEAKEKIERIIKKLKSKVVLPKDSKPSAAAFRSNIPKDYFLKAVEKTKEYVKAGDIIQAVLSQNFQREISIHPINAYRALRVINPSPYMYFLNTGRCTLVGSSPEILVRLEGNTIELRPIAGTRKRGETKEDDLRMEKELKADPKELAEHIMLVDLGRNYFNDTATTESVKVTELMTVERYSHVMHLVSNVVGKLDRGKDAFDLLRASFPAGTVTGAPKIRAMEIIEELEPTKRGPYAGCVGYFDFSGNMDMCITIRTIIFNKKMAYIQAGAGIVADSDPEKEYLETVNKAKGMFKAIEMAENNLE